MSMDTSGSTEIDDHGHCGLETRREIYRQLSDNEPERFRLHLSAAGRRSTRRYTRLPQHTRPPPNQHHRSLPSAAPGDHSLRRARAGHAVSAGKPSRNRARFTTGPQLIFSVTADFRTRRSPSPGVIHQPFHLETTVRSELRRNGTYANDPRRAQSGTRSDLREGVCRTKRFHCRSSPYAVVRSP